VEIGDLVCKVLVSGGTLLMIGYGVGWLVSLFKPNPRESITLPWRRDDDRTPSDSDGAG
jgi:hypothetical protein